jgi:DNA-binding CsgD family transcriptional regulator
LVRNLVNITDAATLTGHPRAERIVATLRHLVDENGGDEAFPQIRRVLLSADYAAGRWSGLAERADAARQDPAALPESNFEARLVAASLAAATQPTADAQGELRAIIDTCLQLGWAELAVRAAGRYLWLAHLHGDSDATERVRPVLDLVRHANLWHWSGDLLPALVDHLHPDSVDEAERLVDQVAETLRHKHAPAAAAGVHEARGTVRAAQGRVQDAVAEYTAGEQASAAVPRPYDAARVLERHGAVLLDSGQPAEAQAILSRAARRYQRLGATVDEARVRRLLRRHALAPRTGRPRGRPGYGDRLSLREAEVATLAAAGLTNRDIATRLSLSERTVSHHLERIMRKLGLSSRRELAGWAAAAG